LLGVAQGRCHSASVRRRHNARALGDRTARTHPRFAQRRREQRLVCHVRPSLSEN
jgi:hypothetical protein